MKRTIIIEDDLLAILKERVKHQTLSIFINQCIREYFAAEKEKMGKETSDEAALTQKDGSRFNIHEDLEIW